MKQNDIAMIVVVIAFSGIFAFILTSFVILPKAEKDLKVKKVSEINSAFQQPDPNFFNKDSINPTKLITIGDKDNKKPF